MYQGRWVIPMRRSNASKPQLKIKFQVSATVDEITPTMNDELESLPSNARITVVNPTASTSNITAYVMRRPSGDGKMRRPTRASRSPGPTGTFRSEEHTSELQSRFDLVCRLLLEKK